MKRESEEENAQKNPWKKNVIDTKTEKKRQKKIYNQYKTKKRGRQK